jgi:hypothetical protein
MQHCRHAVREREYRPPATISACPYVILSAAHFLCDHRMRNPSMDLASSSRYLKYSPYIINDLVRAGFGQSVSCAVLITADQRDCILEPMYRLLCVNSR